MKSHCPVSDSGRRCSFKLTDVLCPDRPQILHQVTADLEVSGQVVFYSDAGHQKECFVIVEVEGILAPLIVPKERVRFLREGDETPVIGPAPVPAS